MKVLDLDAGEEQEFDAGDAARAAADKALVDFDRFTREARPTEWIVDGIIATRTLSLLAGRAKQARKTILALSLIQAVINGRPWLSRATRASDAYFVGFEGGRGFMAQRVVESGHRVAPAPTNPDALPSGATFADGLAGYDAVIAKLRAAAARGEQMPALVVVDTLAHVLARKGVDENDNAEVTVFLSDLERLADQTGAAIVVIHHFAKYTPRMRGASALEAGANWCEIHPIEGAEGVLRLEWTLRNGPPVPPFGVRVAKPNGSFEVEVVDLPKNARGGRSKTVAVRNAINDFLRTRVGRTVSYADLGDAVRNATGLNVSKDAVHRAMQALGAEDDWRGKLAPTTEDGERAITVWSAPAAPSVPAMPDADGLDVDL